MLPGYLPVFFLLGSLAVSILSGLSPLRVFEKEILSPPTSSSVGIHGSA